MAKMTVIMIFLVLFLSTSCGESVKLKNAQKTWCVAKPSSNETSLLSNINYACGYVNCEALKPNGSCFYPETTISHGSVAMNLYYKAEGGNVWNCDFAETALIVITDPSYGNCKYA